MPVEAAVSVGAGLTAMGALLAATTFVLGFAAARWRGERDFLIDRATERHEVLLERASESPPLPMLTLRRHVLALWSDTIGRFFGLSRDVSKGEHLGYHPQSNGSPLAGSFSPSP